MNQHKTPPGYVPLTSHVLDSSDRSHGRRQQQSSSHFYNDDEDDRGYHGRSNKPFRLNEGGSKKGSSRFNRRRGR